MCVYLKAVPTAYVVLFVTIGLLYLIREPELCLEVYLACFDLKS